ncbi:hypothetical protein FQA47_002974 [Oryzias melastigma]|uniref:Uncharacterized protein n=1 Tax=Oryzias melastigma TaxID=30732 RepID=A0A834C007_ORYME|nr:hypothetical protein FQA47_002974 [Oryzias melastigma]
MPAAALGLHPHSVFYSSTHLLYRASSLDQLTLGWHQAARASPRSLSQSVSGDSLRAVSQPLGALRFGTRAARDRYLQDFCCGGRRGLVSATHG